MTCRDGYCSQSQSTSKGTVLSESFPIASSIQSGRLKVETERLLENIEVSANSHEETDSSDTADILTHSIASFARRYLAIAFGESMNAASGDAEQIITAKMQFYESVVGQLVGASREAVTGDLSTTCPEVLAADADTSDAGDPCTPTRPPETVCCTMFDPSSGDVREFETSCDTPETPEACCAAEGEIVISAIPGLCPAIGPSEPAKPYHAKPDDPEPATKADEPCKNICCHFIVREWEDVWDNPIEHQTSEDTVWCCQPKTEEECCADAAEGKETTDYHVNYESWSSGECPSTDIGIGTGRPPIPPPPPGVDPEEWYHVMEGLQVVKELLRKTLKEVPEWNRRELKRAERKALNELGREARER